jgi:rhodanese-related sulfurtransferase
MGKLTDILELARQRAESLALPYAGALTPVEAHEVWQLAPGAKLIDLRTRAELEFVGRIPEALHIEWTQYPSGMPNPNFMQQLRRQADKETLILFICRSSHRSDEAARSVAAAGYASVYNVLEGFEGEVDANGQRGTLGGWRLAGLPWRQD